MMDGRVKTLHPKNSWWHSGSSWSRRSCDGEHNIDAIDLVVVKIHLLQL